MISIELCYFPHTQLINIYYNFVSHQGKRVYYIRNMVGTFAPDTFWKIKPGNIGRFQNLEAKINIKFIALFKDEINNDVLEVPALILSLLPVNFFSSLKFKSGGEMSIFGVLVFGICAVV